MLSYTTLLPVLLPLIECLPCPKVFTISAQLILRVNIESAQQLIELYNNKVGAMYKNQNGRTITNKYGSNNLYIPQHVFLFVYNNMVVSHTQWMNTYKYQLLQYSFLRCNTILMAIYQMLLLKLRFDIYSALTEK